MFHLHPALRRPTRPPAAPAPQPGPDDRVVVLGGGIAGSLLALVLARAGWPVTVVDLRARPQPEFRNEKLGVLQIDKLQSMGVLSCFQEACWGEGAVASPGASPPGRPPLKDCGARYDRWIERLRAAWPTEVDFVEGRARALETSADRQAVVLADGRRIEGRLLVLATGRGERLRASLGVSRRVLSAGHSICVGFSVMPPGGDPWAVPAEIVTGPGGGLAYVTIFPMGGHPGPGELRVNVFSYLPLDHPWVAGMRRDPLGALQHAAPRARGVLEGATLVRPCEVRGTDLYAVDGHVQPGVVLLGDAFHAPCPASGTGLTRILNDVDLLARVHAPRWMASPGMGAEKIAAFYADPVKRQVDAASLRNSKAGRAKLMSASPYWRLRRRIGDVRRAIHAGGT